MTRMAGDQIKGAIYSKEMIDKGIKEAISVLSSSDATEEEQDMAMIRLSELQGLVGEAR